MLPKFISSMFTFLCSQDHTVSESDTPTPEASNSLDEDPPADVLEFADEFNASVATYTESVQQYEEMVAEVEAINEVAEMLVNQVSHVSVHQVILV